MENKKLTLVLNIVKITIAVIGVILTLILLTSDGGSVSGTVSSALTLTYIALGVTTISAIGFGIYLFATNVKKNKGMLIGVIAFFAIILISYLTASTEAVGVKQEVASSSVKLVGAGISAFYIMMIGVIGSIIYAEVNKLIK